MLVALRFFISLLLRKWDCTHGPESGLRSVPFVDRQRPGLRANKDRGALKIG